MKIDEVRRVLIVGAGTVGAQIGVQCAMYGYTSVFYDIDPKALDAAMTRIKAYAAGFVDGGHLTQKEANVMLSKISVTSNPEEAAKEADLLSESVPEEPKLKRQVFAQFNRLCPPRTVFTTNTSVLLPSMLHKATGRPAQFAALHFNPPVWENRIVDVMPHAGTSEETTTLLLEFAKRIGQIPILLKKEHSGYVFNNILSGILSQAIGLVTNGVATVEDVDRAFMAVTKMPIGPFGSMDRIGIDTVWHALDSMAKKYFFIPGFRKAARFLKEYVDKGNLGEKSGKGFYTYPDPAFRRPGFVEGTEHKS